MSDFLTIKMAWLNIWRRSNRTIIVILMIGFGVSGLLLMQGLYKGWLVQSIENALRLDAGHIIIENINFQKDKKLRNRIIESEKLINSIHSIKGVKNIRQRIENEGLAASAKSSFGVKVVGIDIQKEKEFARFDEYIDQGSYILNPAKSQVLIGVKLAKKLNVKLGGKIVVTIQNLQKEIISEALRVKGILRTNNPSADKFSVFMGINRARDFFGVKNASSQIHIKTKPDVSLEKPKGDIVPFLSEELKAFTWKEYFPLFIKWDEMLKLFDWISYGVIFVIVALGIFDIVFVSIMERMREFGIMRAVGTPLKKVYTLLIAESMMIGVLGFFLGAAMGGVLMLYFQIYGLDLSFAAKGLESIAMDKILYAKMEPKFFIQAALAVLVSVLLAVIIPLRMLSKISPTEAIRGV